MMLALMTATLLAPGVPAEGTDDAAIATGTTVGIRFGALDYTGNNTIDLRLLVGSTTIATKLVEPNATGPTRLDGIELMAPLSGTLEGKTIEIAIQTGTGKDLKFTAIPSSLNGTTILRITSVDYREGSEIVASGDTIATLVSSHVDDEITIGFAYATPPDENVTVTLRAQADAETRTFVENATHDGDGQYSARFTLPNLGSRLEWSAEIWRGDVRDGTTGADISFKKGSAQGNYNKDAGSPLVAAGGFHHLVVSEVEIAVSRDILTPSYTGRSTCPQSNAFDTASGETWRLQRYASRGNHCEPLPSAPAPRGSDIVTASASAAPSSLWIIPALLAAAVGILALSLFVARGKA